MTTREMLRNAANNLYAMADYGGNPKHCAEMETQSAALRALADRIDAEMRAVLAMEQETRDTNDASGWGCAAAIAQSLARLDSPTEDR
jgi:hypothetical protein